MDYREIIFEEQDQAILRLQDRIKRMAILAAALSVGIILILEAKNYGIIYHTVRAVAPIWDMLSDIGKACGDFLQYTLRHST